jgi:homoserine dehydrogenase
VRIWVVGFGRVGQWLLRALHSDAERLAAQYGLVPAVVGVANARDGFVHRRQGLDIPTLLELGAAGRPLGEHPGATRWPSALDGLAGTEADVLVEVTASPQEDERSGLAHMREALGRGVPVVTSNKWPVALHGVELAELARSNGVAFRAESTVMSGTPVLGPLVRGLAGTQPIAVRGILNATANFILSAMSEGRSYADALVAAEQAGLAERGVDADVEGHDAVAKLMILAGLLFGRQLDPDQVTRRGITGIDSAQIEAAASAGARIKLLATLEFAPGGGGEPLTAAVEPVALPRDDPLWAVEGVTNAVSCRAEPVGEVTITGPGAGLALAGQGVLSDLIAVRHGRRREDRRAAGTG